MANGSDYVLNFDFWAPLQEDDKGHTRVHGRFARGDTLDGLKLDEKFVKLATQGARPLLLKKNSKEAKQLRGEAEDPEEEGPTTEAASERSDQRKDPEDPKLARK